VRPASRRKFLSISTALALQPAIERRECVVCAVQHHGIERALFWFIEENYSDGPTINKLVGSQGLCVNHIRPLLAPGNHSQVNFVCEVLTGYNWRLASEALRRAQAHCRTSLARLLAGRRGIGRPFVPRSDCPFCLHLQDWESWVLRDLVDFAGDPEVAAASKYTCLPHVLMLIPHTSSDAALALAEAVRGRSSAIRAGDGCESTPAAEFLLGRYPRATRSTFLPAMVAELLTDARPPANAVSMEPGRSEAIADPPDWDRLDWAECILCQAVRAADASRVEGEACGFCRPHARVLLAQAPIATVQQFVEWAPRAVEERLSQRPHRRMTNIVKDTSCPACRRRAHSIAGVLTALQRADPARLAKARFCLPHLPLVLDRVSPEAAVTILRAERDLLRSLHAELEEFSRKLDYRYQHEPLGSEVTAWLRAADILTGSYPPDMGCDTGVKVRQEA
jgi:hypothetical protein